MGTKIQQGIRDFIRLLFEFLECKCYVIYHLK